MKLKKPAKTTAVILSVTAVLLAVLIPWIVWENTTLELNYITVTSERLPEFFSGYKIAHVSDLHNTQMSEDNEKLIDLLKEASPDIIAITGDLVDSYSPNIDVALDFAKKAVDIAPCYYVTGNHEHRSRVDLEKLERGLEEAGVTVLRNQAVTLTVEDESISLIGIDDPTSTDLPVTDRIKGLKDENAAFTLLLSHRPELFNTYCQNDVDLVLSGHAHGGQFRLPFIGGIAAPDQGLFPRYDSGLYTSENTNMVVSRGIGNSIFPFRLNNRPEVVLIELKRSTS